jgi:hypothetical protein
MTYSKLSERLSGSAGRLISRSSFIALALIVTFAMLGTPSAKAQSVSSDTWKSVAIIGGTTAAGAIIGHKIGGSTGTWIGAAAGAAGGYAIDKHRRNNQYYNNGYGYNGYSNPNAGYYGNSDGYYGNSGYNGGVYPSSYPSTYRGDAQYQDSGYSGNCDRRGLARRGQR